MCGAEQSRRPRAPSFDLAPGSRAAVATFARLNRWLQREDLAQEAAVVAIEAARTWREGAGSSRDLWEAWKVGLVLCRFVTKQRSPVHVPDCRGAEGSAERRRYVEASSASRVRLTRMRGKCDASCEVVDDDELARVAVERFVALEDRIDTARACAAIRAMVEQRGPAAQAVLLGEEKPAAVAERLGMSRAEVYDQTARAMRALRAAFVGREERME